MIHWIITTTATNRLSTGGTSTIGGSGGGDHICGPLLKVDSSDNLGDHNRHSWHCHDGKMGLHSRSAAIDRVMQRIWVLMITANPHNHGRREGGAALLPQEDQTDENPGDDRDDGEIDHKKRLAADWKRFVCCLNLRRSSDHYILHPVRLLSRSQHSLYLLSPPQWADMQRCTFFVLEERDFPGAM